MQLKLILPGEGWLRWDDMSTDHERTIYQAGRYTATYSYYGCESSDDIEIMVSDCNPFDIHLPNVFRYNSAENGIFKPVINGDPQSITKYSMLIFDRWGNVVFKSSEPEDGWNGNFSGQASESGVYVYTLDILYSHQGQANQVQKQGSVTLLK
ncbi:MAG: gliding motility-associated C-terminal domain-containing protein [Saprospiraceae bacterium]|nr:gliding motility-associated C-terminal domain-containing protein [Saprospiraceae bacterium]